MTAVIYGDVDELGRVVIDTCEFCGRRHVHSAPGLHIAACPEGRGPARASLLHTASLYRVVVQGAA